jgi:hypothetical protein
VAPHNHGRPECAGADQLYTNAVGLLCPRLPSELASLSGTPDDRYSVFFSYSLIYFIAPRRVFNVRWPVGDQQAKQKYKQLTILHPNFLLVMTFLPPEQLQGC